MTTRAEALASLRATGHRVTPQRQLVLEVIESSCEHLDAESVYQRAREKDPSISLATVYRTLAVLKNMELIEWRHLARNHAREHYEPANTPQHHHFTCLGCHKVIEFNNLHMKQRLTELHREMGIEISHTCICLEGYCPTCVAKRKTTTK